MKNQLPSVPHEDNKIVLTETHVKGEKESKKDLENLFQVITWNWNKWGVRLHKDEVP